MELTKTTFVQTEVGLIPIDWKVYNLGEIAFVTKLAGFEYSLHFNSYKDGGDIIVVRGTNITHNKMDLSDVKTIPSTTSKKLLRSKLFKNDLVFAYVGTIGPVFLIEEDDKYHLGPNTAKISAVKEIDPKYLFHYFTSPFILNEIFETTSIGAQPSLSMSKIRGFNIVTPTLTEQKAIATALSDIDSLISSLDKLISKKKAIKQGAIQELLTPPHQGGRRLPGYSGEWVEIELKEKYTFINGKPYENKLDSSGEYFLITLDSVNIEGNLKANHKRVDFYDNSLIKGDLVTVLSDIAHAKLLGLSGYITENKKYVLNQRMGRLRFDSDIDPQFARYQINYHQEYFKNRGQGSSQRHIYKKDFDEFILKYPKKNEQQQIVEILNDLQDEINTLICKKSKFLDLKQGMMQELLTGKTRLI